MAERLPSIGAAFQHKWVADRRSQALTFAGHPPSNDHIGLIEPTRGITKILLPTGTLDEDHKIARKMKFKPFLAQYGALNTPPHKPVTPVLWRHRHRVPGTIG